MQLVDSHCHLDLEPLKGQGSAVIARALAAGVGRQVTICTRLERWPALRPLVESEPSLYAAIGVHPNESGGHPPFSVEDLLRLAEHPKVVGIGESGLDYHYDFAPRDQQARSFRLHIEAARQSGLPLIVHAREAEADMIAILRDESARNGAFPCVLHCFSSGQALAEAALALGHFISFSGILTFPKANELRQIFLSVPQDRILIETDSPYLAPVPKRGQPNEPAFVRYTAEVAAELLGMPLADFAALTQANFHRLFAKVPQ